MGPAARSSLLRAAQTVCRAHSRRNPEPPAGRASKCILKRQWRKQRKQSSSWRSSSLHWQRGFDSMDLVSKHLARWRREPFVWGTSDCMLSIADYLDEVYGGDCAAQYRGRYSTRRGCMKVTGFHRPGFPPAFACCGIYHLPYGTSGARGDVAVVRYREGQQAVGAVSLGGGFWAARTERGVAIGKSPHILAAWGVECRQ